MLWFALCPIVLFVAGGCSGINASKSVAPIDILPYLLQANPPPARPDCALPAEEPVQQIAQN
jgi:hypothetical protein